VRKTIVLFQKINKDNFGKNHKKNHMEKHCNNSQCLNEKNHEVKFLISLILKKIDRDNFRKKNNKTNTKKREKKSCWKHCRNSQCFVMKATVLPSHDLALFVMTCNCNSQTTQY
jgi:hypothetical protein